MNPLVYLRFWPLLTAYRNTQKECLEIKRTAEFKNISRGHTHKECSFLNLCSENPAFRGLYPVANQFQSSFITCSLFVHVKTRLPLSLLRLLI